jgi:hypothetical protein
MLPIREQNLLLPLRYVTALAIRILQQSHPTNSSNDYEGSEDRLARETSPA